MRARSISGAVHLASRLVPASLFLWAGLAKAFDRQGSILTVDAYDVLPARAVEIVAVALPWLEIGIAVLLVLGLFTRVAGVSTAVLASVFVAGLAQAKARGLSIDCGRFGGGGAGAGVTWADIVRDIPLIGAGAFLAWRPRGPWQLDESFREVEGDEPIGGPQPALEG